MKLLNKKQVEALEAELHMLHGVSTRDGFGAYLRAKEIVEELDKAYHTNVEFELKIIKGGKSNV